MSVLPHAFSPYTVKVYPDTGSFFTINTTALFTRIEHMLHTMFCKYNSQMSLNIINEHIFLQFYTYIVIQ